MDWGKFLDVLNGSWAWITSPSAPVLQNWILVIQTILLAYYALETLRIRIQAGEENRNLSAQLAAMEKQTALTREMFERQLEEQKWAVRPIFRFQEGAGARDKRFFFAINEGDRAQILEWRASTGQIDLDPGIYLNKSEGVNLRIPYLGGAIFFGVRYKNRYSQVETQCWEIPNGSAIPLPSPTESFENWHRTLPHG